MKKLDYFNLRELLLNIIRPDAKQDNVLGLIDKIGPDLSHWSGLLNMSLNERIRPLLYYRFNQLGLFDLDKVIPEPVREILKKAYETSAARNIFLRRRLEEILHALHSRDIKVILLKGAIALMEDLYPDKNLRIMSDLDLLVPRAKLSEAGDVLKELHYLLQEEHLDGRSQIISKSSLLTIEIKNFPLWGKNVHYLPLEVFWSNAWRKDKEGIPFLLPSPTDQLYHLLIHESIEHQWVFNYRIIAIYEIYLLINLYRDKIDFHILLERARKFNLERLFMFYLITAEEKIGPVLPPSVRELFGSSAERSKYWYNRVPKNPICFRNASKRFFFILTTSYSLKSYLKNLYCALIEEVVIAKSDQLIRSNPRLSIYLSIPLLKAYFVIRRIFLHIVITLMFLFHRSHAKK